MVKKTAGQRPRKKRETAKNKRAKHRGHLPVCRIPTAEGWGKMGRVVHGKRCKYQEANTETNIHRHGKKKHHQGVQQFSRKEKK